MSCHSLLIFECEKIQSTFIEYAILISKGRLQANTAQQFGTVDCNHIFLYLTNWALVKHRCMSKMIHGWLGFWLICLSPITLNDIDNMSKVSSAKGQPFGPGVCRFNICKIFIEEKIFNNFSCSLNDLLYSLFLCRFGSSICFSCKL